MTTIELAKGLAALSLTATLHSGCVVDALETDAAGTFERTLSVSGPVDLSVRTGAGGIQVRTGSGDTVRIVGHVRARTMWTVEDPKVEVERLLADPPIEQAGDTIRIGATQASMPRSVSISYELTVPANTRLQSRTGSGNQLIGDLQGPLEAKAGSGEIKVGRIGGDVIVSTGSGDIDLVESRGRFDAKAGSGTIRATGVGGAIRARAGSGRIDVEQTAAGEIDVATGSGDIIVKGAQGPIYLRAGSGDISINGQPSDDWRVKTGSGSVAVRVPNQASFAIDAETRSGSIDITHPIQESDTRTRRRLQGTIGRGGPRLELSTGSGRIRID